MKTISIPYPTNYPIYICNSEYHISVLIQGSGEAIVTVEGNEIHIHFDEAMDYLSDRKIPEQDYIIQFNGKEIFNTYYITMDEVYEQIKGIVETQLREGLLTDAYLQSLKSDAYNEIVFLKGEEYIQQMSTEERSRLILDSEIAMITGQEIGYCFTYPRARSVDMINEIRAQFVGTLQILALLMVLTNPGTAAAGMMELIAGISGVGEGVIRIDQGETVEGVSEIAFSTLETLDGIKNLYKAGKLDTLLEVVNDNRGGIGVPKASSETSSVKFSNWDEMKETYKGTVTKFVKENKPKNSPIPKNWFEKGGTLEIESFSDGTQIWKYTSANGDTVPYVNGYICFPEQYLNPDIPYVDIGEFTGNRATDKQLVLEILEEEYGITEVPQGYILYHDVENGIIQLVEKDIHEQFTHIGGNSLYNGE